MSNISEQLHIEFERLKKEKDFLVKIYRNLLLDETEPKLNWKHVLYSERYSIDDMYRQFSMRNILNFRFWMLFPTWNDQVLVSVLQPWSDESLLFFIRTAQDVNWNKKMFWQTLLESDDKRISSFAKAVAYQHFCNRFKPHKDYCGTRFSKNDFFGVVEYTASPKQRKRWQILSKAGLTAFAHGNYATAEIEMALSPAKVSDWFTLLLEQSDSPEIIIRFLQHHSEELGVSLQIVLRYVCMNYAWQDAKSILTASEKLFPRCLRDARDEYGNNLLYYISRQFNRYAVTSGKKAVFRTTSSSEMSNSENIWIELNPNKHSSYHNKDIARGIKFLLQHGVSPDQLNRFGFSFRDICELRCHKITAFSRKLFSETKPIFANEIMTIISNNQK